MPRLPAVFGITCDLCGTTFGTMLTEVEVRGMTLKAICRACTEAIAERDGGVPASTNQWNEAIKKSVRKPAR